MIRAISWNIAKRSELWRELLASEEVDIALLQEAGKPPQDVCRHLGVSSEPWEIHGGDIVRKWRSAVARVNQDAKVQWYTPRPLGKANSGDLAVSRMGTIAAADVRDPDTGEVFTFVSLYSCWETPHPAAGRNWIYADGSAHRLISDLSALVGRQQGHRIVAAGDLNILYGYGEHGSGYWASRYQTVFDRIESIGLQFVGPQSPNGRQAHPWPSELPRSSANVPTFHTAEQTPEGATRQLDFVFASAGIADRVRTKALNRVDEWGASDHCRIEIEIASPAN